MGIDDTWVQIEQWYAERDSSALLSAPAEPAEIDELERVLGYALPADWRASLLRHDGTAEGGWPDGTLLSVAGIQSETSVWREVATEWSDEDRRLEQSSDAFEAVWWHRGWICLDADGAGNGSVVDLAPTQLGRLGQILDMDHEVGPSGPINDDVADYLASVLAALDRFEIDDGQVVEVADDEDEDEEPSTLQPLLGTARLTRLDDGRFTVIGAWSDGRLSEVSWTPGESTDTISIEQLPSLRAALDAAQTRTQHLRDQGWTTDSVWQQGLVDLSEAVQEDDTTTETLQRLIDRMRSRLAPEHEPDPLVLAPWEVALHLSADDWSALRDLAAHALTVNPGSAFWLFYSGQARYLSGDEGGLDELVAAWQIEGDEIWDGEDEELRQAARRRRNRNA